MTATGGNHLVRVARLVLRGVAALGALGLVLAAAVRLLDSDRAPGQVDRLLREVLGTDWPGALGQAREVPLVLVPADDAGAPAGAVAQLAVARELSGPSGLVTATLRIGPAGAGPAVQRRLPWDALPRTVRAALIRTGGPARLWLVADRAGQH